MEYTLQDHGDPFEKKFLSYLGQSFSNYETFWRKFIVPLTGRITSGDIQLRRGVDPLLEEMCMAHYSVYYSLGFSYHLIDNFGVDYFQAILYHLSTATEMVDRLLFAVAKIESKLHENGNFVEKLNREELTQRVEKYALAPSDTNKAEESMYDQQFRRFHETGQSANITFHDLSEFVSKYWKEVITRPDNKVYGAWRGIALEIKNYRNTLIHNPLLGRLVDNDGTIYVPKHDRLKKYRSWSAAIYSPESKDFIPLITCIPKYQSEFTNRTNELWGYILVFVERLSQQPNYKRLSESGLDSPRESSKLVSEAPTFTQPPRQPSGLRIMEIAQLSSGASGAKFKKD